MTSGKSLAVYASSFAPGSHQRAEVERLATLARARIWISLDPIGQHKPPPGVLWLRLGEQRLKQPGWRQTLTLLSKLAPALHVLDFAQLLCLDEAAGTRRLFGSLLTLLSRTAWRASLPMFFLRILSPARARQLALQQQDLDGQLRQLFDVSHYLGFQPPISGDSSPLAHYLAAGQYAGLNPHPLFWTDYYATQFAGGFDGLAPWRHFVESSGNPNPFFLTRWYMQQPEAGRHHSNPLLDMLAHHRAGHMPPDPNPLFDQAWYISHHDCHGMLPLSHFLLTDTRLPTCPFLARHPEIAPIDDNGETYLPAFLSGFSGHPSAVPAASCTSHSMLNLNGRHIAICCVVTGNYDTPHAPGHRIPEADYYLLCDQPPSASLGNWKIVQIEPAAGQSVQSFSRYLKMNLPSHIPAAGSYDAIVYIDANISLRGDIAPIISGFLASDADVGVVPHPFRQSVYEEAATVMLHMRESREQVGKVIEMLEQNGCPPSAGLFEMNFFILRPGTGADRFLKDWWTAFQQFGSRDQLLAPFIAWKHRLNLHALMPAGLSVRTHPAFQYRPH